MPRGIGYPGDRDKDPDFRRKMGIPGPGFSAKTQMGRNLMLTREQRREATRLQVASQGFIRR